MDKKREFIILLVIYFKFVISQDVLSIQSISPSNSTGVSYFTSSILLRHANNTPAASSFWTQQSPSLSWTVLADRSSTNMKIQSVISSNFNKNVQLAISSSLKTSANSPTIMHFKTFSTPFHIYTSIEKGISAELSASYELHSHTLDLKHYPSKSGSLNAFSTSSYHALNSLAVTKSTPVHGVIFNTATSVLSYKISSLSQSTVDTSINQFSLEQTKISLQPLISASLPSKALSNISLSTSKTYKYQYVPTIRTVTASAELSQINITKSHQITMQTKDSENYSMPMSTAQLSNTVTSPIFKSNSTYQDRINPSSHTHVTGLVSFNTTAMQPSHAYLESLNIKHSSALIMSSKSTKVSSTNSLKHHFDIFSSPHFSSTPSSITIQRITKSFGFDNTIIAATSESSSTLYVSPTTKNPFSNIDVKKKNKKVTGFPAWVIILLCVAAVAAILIIVALVLRLIRWNKDHGDYSLWTSNLELQPITSRNTEVLT